MTAFEKVDRFVRNLYETVFYLAVMAWKENFRNSVGRAGTVGQLFTILGISSIVSYLCLKIK